MTVFDSANSNQAVTKLSDFKEEMQLISLITLTAMKIFLSIIFIVLVPGNAATPELKEQNLSLWFSKRFGRQLVGFLL